MRSFKFKNKRTTQININGETIPTTFNASSKQSIYTNKNPRFTMTCKNRANGGGKGCTNTGCGKQCCLLPFLITDISLNDYSSNNLSTLLVPGNTLNNSNGGVIGSIDAVIFPYACCQDPSGVLNCDDSTWPLTIQLIVTAASGSCANPNYSGGFVYIKGKEIKGSTALDGYEVMGESKKGAPYRNPIFGYRKFLADASCCLVNDSSDVKSDQKNQAQNDIYKDMHAKYTGKFNIFETGSLLGNKTPIKKHTDDDCVAYDTRIRSGMQPKPAYCCKKKDDKVIITNTSKYACNGKNDCTNGKIHRNNYSYDYRQYLHNKSLKSFERSQDKFFTMRPINLTQANTPKIQNTLGDFCNSFSMHGCNTLNNGTSSGVTNIPMLYSKGLCHEGQACQATLGRHNPTIYKPNNRKFSKQGAVTSSGRLERLKLDTLKRANSRCSTPNACRTITATNGLHTKTYKTGKGPYFAAKPRFTGWMFNSRHREVVSGVKYKPLPFGIPQLTNKGRSTNSYFLNGNTTKRNRGEKVKAIWQRPNLKTSRAPGGCSKAIPGKDGCPALCNNAKGPGCIQGNPCCK
jgi:hypothetical protein